MPDEYDAYRRNLSSYEKGLYFELGRAREQGETPERGWVPQFEIQIGQDRRRLDSARSDGRAVRGKERKSGRMNEREVLVQLNLERTALEKGQMASSVWETVAGEKIPPTVAAELQAMARDFGTRFQHIELSRADALRAMKLGRSLAGKQLELIRPYQLERAERARQRLENIRRIARARERAEQFKQLAKAHEKAREGARSAQIDLAKARERAESFRKIGLLRDATARGRAEAPERVRQEQAQAAELAKTREKESRENALEAQKRALTKTLEEQARQINEKRDKGQAVEVDHLREVHANLSKDLQAIREAERAQAMEMLTAAGYTQDQAKTMQAMLEQERERLRRNEVRGIDTIGVIIEHEDRAREAETAREAGKAPEREAGRELTEAEQRERSERERLAELQRLYRESNAYPPREAVRHPPAPERADERHRGDRGQARGRDFGRER